MMTVTVGITVGIGTVGIRIMRFGLGVSRTLANTLGASVGERSASGVTGYASKAIIATIAIGIGAISIGISTIMKTNSIIHEGRKNAFTSKEDIKSPFYYT